MNDKTIRIVSHFLKPFLKKLPRHGGQRVILVYHGISKRVQFNCVTQSLFRAQISWLKENYSVVSLDGLIKDMISPFLPERANAASITFDDGYFNFAELALPLLQELNCHSTLFIPVMKVGSYNDWDQDMNGFHKMNIMTYETLRALPEQFVEIGSHGLYHIPLNGSDFSVIQNEVVNSRFELEQNVGRRVRFFAFPYGIYPLKHMNKLINEDHFLGGYKAACTSWWGRYNSIKDIYMLRRIGMWDSDSFGDFINKLNGRYDWLEKKEALGRYLKMMRRL